MASFHDWCVKNEPQVRVLYDALSANYTPDEVEDWRLKRKCPDCASEGSRVVHLRRQVFEMVQYVNQIQKARSYRGWETDLKDFGKNMGEARRTRPPSPTWTGKPPRWVRGVTSGSRDERDVDEVEGSVLA